MFEKIAAMFGGSILGGVKELIGQFHMSPEEQAKLEVAIREQEMKVRLAFFEADKAQMEVNKEEAKSSMLWVSGWRPFIGWVCGGALAYVWIVRDWITYTIAVLKLDVPPPPMVMNDSILELTLGMLGLAGLRSWEKVKSATVIKD